MSPMVTTKDKVVIDILENAQRKVRTGKSPEKIEQETIKVNWSAIKRKGFGYNKESRPTAVLDYDEGRMLYDVLPDGTWKGQRCFIIGGGESLRGFDFSKLKNEMVIGVNRAFEKIDCMINYSMDYELFLWIKNGKLGPATKKKFEDYKGYPVWIDNTGYDYPKGIFILNSSDTPAVANSMSEGLWTGTNAGFGALNLAVALGANPIYLLGFDMKGKNGRQAWWHSGYKGQQGAKVYESFISDFERIAPMLKEKGIKVINLNKESNLKAFNFGNFEDIKPIDRPVIASYYTKNTEYETQIEELRTTCRRFNLEHEIVGIKDLGGWHKNTYWKSTFVLDTLKKYPDRSVVFVDADAVFRQSPILFSDFDCDFAYHYYNRKELLGGTLYFGNTKGARFVAKKWVEIDKRELKTHMPQKNLQELFNRIKNKVTWKELPIEYCMIFDCHQRYRQNLKPVIEHFQLSRKHKDQHLKSSRYRMKEGLVRIQKMCTGKKICLIGNADTMLEKKRGDIIDSYDIVCRMNRGKVTDKEAFIGSKADLLFLSTGMSRKSIEVGYGNGKKYPIRQRTESDLELPVIWMTVCHRLAHPWIIVNAIQNPKKDWHELHRLLGINPTTGMMALKFCLKYLNFESLDIYGFNFLTTKSWYNTQPDKGEKHSGEKERVLFAKMIKGRKNVRHVQ